VNPSSSSPAAAVRGRTWHLHQVPAFLAAGYRVITFDNRGVGADGERRRFTTETMVADTAALD